MVSLTMMDVDSNASNLQHPPAINPLGLSQVGITSLNKGMNKLADRYNLRAVVQQIGDDRSEWSELIVQDRILTLLKTLVLSAKFIDHSKQFAENMNDDEFREWRDGVLTGLRDRNWAELAAHRMCLLVSKGLVQLIASIAKLRIPPSKRTVKMYAFFSYIITRTLYAWNFCQGTPSYDTCGLRP